MSPVTQKPALLEAALLAAAALSALAAAPRAFAGTDREISVSGSCNRAVTSDRAAVVITADYLEADVKSATRKATEAYDRVRDGIRKLNLENMELQTVEYSVNEAREWQKDKVVSKGFRTRIGLRVSTSQPQRLGEAIGIAAKEGIRDVGALTSYLSDQKRLAEHMACLEEAATNGRAKAERLAKALSARLGPVLSITESAAGVNPPETPRLMTAMSARMDAAPAPEIEAGKQEISVSVNARFALE